MKIECSVEELKELAKTFKTKKTEEKISIDGNLVAKQTLPSSKITGF